MAAAKDRPAEKIQPESFSKHMFDGMLIVVAVSALTLIAAHFGLLLPFERIGLDTLLRSRHYQTEDTIIVEITPDDYAKEFGRESPLNRDKVKQLIETIAEGSPRVIGVDLDSANAVDGKSRESLPDEIQRDLDSSWKRHGYDPNQYPEPKVIWPELTKAASGGNSMPEVVDAHERVSGSFGLTLFPKEHDGSVRAFVQEVVVRRGHECALWPTLPRVILSAYKGGIAAPEGIDCGHEGEEPTILNLSRDRSTFTRLDAASLLALSPRQSADSVKKLLSVFQGKIVLLGGAYPEARDEYQTAVGVLSGIELVAFATQTLRDQRVVRPLEKTMAAGIDLIVGLAILYVSYKFHQSAAIAVVWSLLTAIFAPVMLSYVVFRSTYYWMSFFPVIIGAFMHIAYDAVNDLHRKQQEVAQLKGDLKQKEEDLDRREKEIETLRAAQLPPSVIIENFIGPSQTVLQQPPIAD